MMRPAPRKEYPTRSEIIAEAFARAEAMAAKITDPRERHRIMDPIIRVALDEPRVLLPPKRAAAERMSYEAKLSWSCQETYDRLAVERACKFLYPEPAD